MQNSSLNSLEHINTYLQSIEKQNFVILDNIKRLQEKLKSLLNLKKEIESIKQEVAAFKKDLLFLKQKTPQMAVKSSSKGVEETISEKSEESIKIEQPRESEKTIGEETESVSFPYIQVFLVGSHYFALPLDRIANVYSLSPKKIKKLLDKEKIYLKELKGFLGKLSKNMKGSLRQVKEKNLEKIEAFVFHLPLAEKKEIEYNEAVLIDCEKRYGVIFVSEFLDKVFLPEKGEKIQKGEIEARVFIPELGKIYLINPCALFNR